MKSSRDPEFRPDLYLVARIINVIHINDSLQKTQLAVQTGIAYDRLLNYISWLKEKELVRADASVVTLTKKGAATYGKLVDWIMEYVGRLDFHRR